MARILNPSWPLSPLSTPHMVGWYSYGKTSDMCDMSQSGICCLDCCIRSFKAAYAFPRRPALSGACLSGVWIFEDAYTTWKKHTLSRFRFRLLGFGFELVGLSKPYSRAYCSKLHCDKQDSIVIETRDSEFL